MMVSAFILAFAFSFIGTIPPGTLNLTVLQLGLENKIKSALQFSIGAAIVEYPYCWIAIRFEEYITSSPAVVNNFERIGAVVMLTLGFLNLLSLRKPATTSARSGGGFAKGLVLGILNPLAMPYWVGITAYLKSQGWLVLDSTITLHAYLIGVVLGAIAFFLLIAYAANRVGLYLKGNSVVRYIPGVVLVVLGFYGLVLSLT